MAAGIPIREIEQYLTSPTTTNRGFGHDDYIKNPATAFLRYAVEAKNVEDISLKSLLKNPSRPYRNKSLETMQHIVSSMLPPLMGHFQAFQRHMFAGIFDRSVKLQVFSVEDLLRRLNWKESVISDEIRRDSNRSTETNSAGMRVADRITNWDNPEQVNEHFRIFFDNINCFSDRSIERLNVLFQLNHSILHCCGTLTFADAQNVASLKRFGDSEIAFENHFINEVVRKLHPIVREFNFHLRGAFVDMLSHNLTDDNMDDIKAFFTVSSTTREWLKWRYL